MKGLWNRFVRWLARDKLAACYYEGYRFGYDGGILDDAEYHDWLFLSHFPKHGVGEEWIGDNQ